MQLRPISSVGFYAQPLYMTHYNLLESVSFCKDYK